MNKIKLPNFLVVGAMKSGTTSLYQYIKEHPEIYLPQKKEPRFFASSVFLKIDDAAYKFQNKCNSKPYSSFKEYLKLFDDVKGEKAIGEASPHYLFTHKTTIPLIIKYLGRETKIIIILRNPLDRALSAYKHNYRNNTNSSFKENLSFSEALKIEEKRYKEDSFPMMFYYKRLGLYYEQVKSYMENFNDVFICLNEELEHNRKNLIKDIYTFLNVNNEFTPELELKYNESIIVKQNILYNFLMQDDHPLKKRLRKILLPLFGEKQLAKWVISLKKLNSDKKIFSIDIESRKYLNNYFRDDIKKLEFLINKNLDNWIKI